MVSTLCYYKRDLQFKSKDHEWQYKTELYLKEWKPLYLSQVIRYRPMVKNGSGKEMFIKL
jgi:hypothetical protein